MGNRGSIIWRCSIWGIHPCRLTDPTTRWECLNSSSSYANSGDLVIWTSDGEPGKHYLALFNLGDSSMQIDRPYNTMGMPKQQFVVRELWRFSHMDLRWGTGEALSGAVQSGGFIHAD